MWTRESQLPRAIGQTEGIETPVKVENVHFGEKGLPLSLRLLPLIVCYTLVIAGVWVPTSSLVEEKENSTLVAMLVTPV